MSKLKRRPDETDEQYAALDAFDAIVADILGALPRHADTDSLAVRRVDFCPTCVK